MSGSRCLLVVCTSLLLPLTGCRSPNPPLAAPISPEAAVRGFMAAVAADDLTAMSHLWGSERGLAARRMENTELEQRLQVIQIYLRHESFEVRPSSPRPGVAPDREQQFNVRVLRDGCVRDVPFTLRPHGGGWLVYDVDLEAVGNPTTRCTAGDP